MLCVAAWAWVWFSLSTEFVAGEVFFLQNMASEGWVPGF